tara:strand:- start:292 stop:3216 length:2925 start_codon:yes stop_codon:yes gene_type:complete
MSLRAGALTGLLNQPSAQVINGSLKFEKGSSQSLSRTPSSASNRKTYTISYWIKRTIPVAKFSPTTASVFGVEGGSSWFDLSYYTVDEIQFVTNAGVGDQGMRTESQHRDFSNFAHICAVVDTTLATTNDRMRVYVNGVLQKQVIPSGMPSASQDTHVNNTNAHHIGRDGRTSSIRYGDHYLSQFYLIDGLALGPGYFGFTDPLTGTWRPKRFRAEGTTLNDGTTWSSNVTGANNPANAFDGSLSSNMDSNGSAGTPIVLTATFKNVTSFRYYTSNGSAHDVSFNGGPTYRDSAASGWRTIPAHLVPSTITSISWIHSNQPSAYVIVEAIEINGEILRDTTTTNLAFGTNGFYLPMDNQDDFEKDKSGNGNHFTKNNFSGTSNDPDVVKDSPSGAVFGGRAQTGITTTSSAPSNYATLNPVNLHNTADTLSDGNLKLTGSGSGAGHFARSTLAMSTGKYFMEVTWISTTKNFCGIQGSGDINYNNSYVYISNGKASNANGSSEGGSYGDSWGNDDVIGIAYDADAKTLTFYKNGVSQGVAFTNITGTYSQQTNPGSYTFFFGNWDNQNCTFEANFGQKPFKYAPPQGYLPVNSASLRADAVIPRPDQYVGVTTYVGQITDTSSQTVRGINFESDMVWIKRRDGSNSHQLVDSVRGTGKWIEPSGTNVESSSNTNGVLTAINSNGFTLTGGSSNGNLCCEDGFDYVAWCWKAGGSKGTFNVDDVGYATAAAAGITDGDAALTGASVGTKQGFSIVKWTTTTTGQSFSHALPKAPDFILAKSLNGAHSWRAWHKNLTSGSNLLLDTNQAESSYDDDIASVTSTVVNVVGGGPGSTNGPNIAYCWHDVPGFQKFGSYQNKDSSNGGFVELGFKPAVLIFKCTRNISSSSGAGDWIIRDTVRNPYNDPNDGNTLVVNVVNGEDAYYGATQVAIDILSNGFKIRHPNSSPGGDPGRLYTYAAWAEAPVGNLFGGQSTAR